MRLSYLVATPEVCSPQVMALRGPLRENLATVAELGFDGVELAVRNPDNLDAAEVEREARRAALPVCHVGTAPIYMDDRLYLCHPEEEVRREALRRLLRTVDLAARFGCDVNLGQFRGRLLDGEGRERSLSWMRGAIAAGADYAAEKGLRLLLEPHHRFSTNFLISAEEGVAFLREWDHKGLGLMLDTFHMNIEDASFAGAIFAAREHLTHFHVADNNRLPPGGGHIPFGEVVGALKAVGYRGFLSAQVAQKPDPRGAAERSLRHLRSLL